MSEHANAKARKVQPVSFNLSDPFESELLDYALRHGAFSKFIKRLIQREKEGVGRVEVAPIVREPKRKMKADSFV